VKKIRAIIFDFDGLILETEEPVYQSWQELYTSFSRQMSFEDWAMLIGTAPGHFDPMSDLEKQLGRSLEDPATLEAKRFQREMEIIYTRPVQPGVMAYLDTAKRLGLKIGLASSSSAGWVKGHLSRLGLIHYFDCIRTAEDVDLVKPDPKLYLQVLSALETTPQEAIALEDSPNGVTAAKQAGLYCVAIPNVLTSRLPLDHADLRLKSLEELPLEELIRLAENHRSLLSPNRIPDKKH
jgi:HAD superfamily hydrolase (TIGR01509 family)